MKLIIDIDDEMYDFTINARQARTYTAEHYVDLILNGEPLTEERLTMSERLKLVKNTRNMVLEKVEEKIDFEEKWLIDIKMENGFISIADIEVAMSGIRSVITELKGENK